MEGRAINRSDGYACPLLQTLQDPVCCQCRDFKVNHSSSLTPSILSLSLPPGSSPSSSTTSLRPNPLPPISLPPATDVAVFQRMSLSFSFSFPSRAWLKSIRLPMSPPFFPHPLSDVSLTIPNLLLYVYERSNICICFSYALASIVSVSHRTVDRRDLANIVTHLILHLRSGEWLDERRSFVPATRGHRSDCGVFS